jgi:hypothetical protein
MPSKVEELRDVLYTQMTGYIKNKAEEYGWAYKREDDTIRQVAVDLYALISAARAEGVEEERERIKEEGDHIRQGFAVDNSRSDHLVYEEDDREYLAACDLYIIPASVLAPTKEREMDREEYDLKRKP